VRHGHRRIHQAVRRRAGGAGQTRAVGGGRAGEIGLAQALDGKKDHKAALAAAARAWERAVTLASDDVLWRALVAQARALRRLGEVAPALAVAKQAVATIDRMKLQALARPDARIASDSVAAFAILAVLQSESAMNQPSSIPPNNGVRTPASDAGDQRARDPSRHDA
jgi:hypothetical protein